LERVRRHIGTGEAFGANAGSPKDVLIAAAGVPAEDVVLLAELQVFRGFHVGPAAGACAIQVVDVESDNLFGVFIGKRRQQDVLDDAEHRGPGPDSERKRENRQ
jgi:hypothetical protein